MFALASCRAVFGRLREEEVTSARRRISLQSPQEEGRFRVWRILQVQDADALVADVDHGVRFNLLAAERCGQDGPRGSDAANRLRAAGGRTRPGGVAESCWIDSSRASARSPFHSSSRRILARGSSAPGPSRARAQRSREPRRAGTNSGSSPLCAALRGRCRPPAKPFRAGLPHPCGAGRPGFDVSPPSLSSSTAAARPPSTLHICAAW